MTPLGVFWPSLHGGSMTGGCLSGVVLSTSVRCTTCTDRCFVSVCRSTGQGRAQSEHDPSWHTLEVRSPVLPSLSLPSACPAVARSHLDHIIHTVPYHRIVRTPYHGVGNLTFWHPLLPYGYSYKKHPVPDRVKPSFVIFDIRALWRSPLSVRVPGCQNYKWRLNPVCYRMLLCKLYPYGYTRSMAK